jgi:hypothetical protein
MFHTSWTLSNASVMAMSPSASQPIDGPSAHPTASTSPSSRSASSSASTSASTSSTSALCSCSTSMWSVSSRCIDRSTADLIHGAVISLGSSPWPACGWL